MSGINSLTNISDSQNFLCLYGKFKQSYDASEALITDCYTHIHYSKKYSLFEVRVKFPNSDKKNSIQP